MAKKVTTDQKTLDLIEDIKNRKKEISQLERPNWRTNCTFSCVEGKLNDAINLHVEKSVKNLIVYASYLRDKERSYNETALALGVEAPAFSWNGFSVSDWCEDIRMQINKIQIASKKVKLEQLESRLSAIISPELKRELELQAIEDELK